MTAVSVVTCTPWLPGGISRHCAYAHHAPPSCRAGTGNGLRVQRRPPFSHVAPARRRSENFRVKTKVITPVAALMRTLPPACSDPAPSYEQSSPPEAGDSSSGPAEEEESTPAVEEPSADEEAPAQ